MDIGHKRVTIKTKTATNPTTTTYYCRYHYYYSDYYYNYITTTNTTVPTTCADTNTTTTTTTTTTITTTTATTTSVCMCEHVWYVEVRAWDLCECGSVSTAVLLLLSTTSTMNISSTSVRVQQLLCV